MLDSGWATISRCYLSGCFIQRVQQKTGPWICSLSCQDMWTTLWMNRKSRPVDNTGQIYGQQMQGDDSRHFTCVSQFSSYRRGDTGGDVVTLSPTDETFADTHTNANDQKRHTLFFNLSLSHKSQLSNLVLSCPCSFSPSPSLVSHISHVWFQSEKASFDSCF